MIPSILIVLLFCWWSQPVQAAITDGTVSSTKCAADTCSLSHAVGAANLEAIVTVHWFSTSSRTVSSLTIGGTPAVLIGRVENPSCAGGRCGVEKWRLTNPSIGTPTVLATLDATAQIILGVKTYAGVDATTPIGTVVSTTGTASAPSITLSTATGDIIDGGLAIANAGGVPSATAATQYYSDYDPAGFTQGASSSMSAGGSSTVYGWTYPTAQNFAVLAVPLKADGTGGGGASTERLTWTDLSSGQRQETNTRVFWRHTTQPTYQLLATLVPDSVSYIVTYTTQTERCYVVDQINSAGTSPLSNELCSNVAAAGPIFPPLAPPTFAGGLSDE